MENMWMIVDRYGRYFIKDLTLEKAWEYVEKLSKRNKTYFVKKQS
jgi:hypothetical protein